MKQLNFTSQVFAKTDCLFRNTTWLPSFRKPGTYKVSLSYENQPSREWGGIELGTHHPIAMWRVKHSTECSLTSNEVLVTVTE
ncbi:MAG TPA: hypothetical protein VF075_15190 [Pyrinomonadaceae bacterium]